MKTVRSWWGKRFIEALERFTDSARLQRGRSYAGASRIKSWHIEGHAISATIRGNVNPYFGVYKEPTYTTTIRFSPIKAEQWRRITRVLGGRAAYISRLLLNDMPENIEEPFQELGLNLLPCHRSDLETDCSCPDYANPCKHIAGLYYFIAELLDRDPFLLFEWRGLSRTELQQQLLETPLGQALALSLRNRDAEITGVDGYFTRPQPQELALPASANDYWRSPKRLPDSLEAASPPPIAALLVKKGGDYPAFWPCEHSFIETMESLYQAIGKRHKDW